MTEGGGGAGVGPILYEAGMMLDEQQQQHWAAYTEQNRENYFWLFLDSFVEKWDQKVNRGDRAQHSYLDPTRIMSSNLCNSCFRYLMMHTGLLIRS